MTRTSVCVAVLLGLTVVAISGAAVSLQAASTLGAAAAQSGRYMGAALSASHLGDSRFISLLDTEFNCVTPENEMKWETVEPSQNNFNFGPGDQVFNHATQHGMIVRGHTLVWHSQLPGWVQNLRNADQLRAAMTNHINKTMAHYKGKIYAWDVVNEAFADDGSGRTHGSIFKDVLGDAFLEIAFTAARAADPDAKLCYNDYSTDGINAKSTGVYNMVKDFKARGVPIDCVGFQSHLGTYPPSDYQANLQRFSDLGVEVVITELDIPQAGSAAYGAVTKACTAVALCKGITTWGVTDNYSWKSGDNPLLFNSNYQKKAAYQSVLDAFNAATPAPPPPTPSTAPAPPPTPSTAPAPPPTSSTAPAPPPPAPTTICATAAEGQQASLSCPAGKTIKSITFASYGLPSGSCPSFTAGSCHASSSVAQVQSACVGKSSCSVAASNNVFGDPCSGRGKTLDIAATCA